MPSLADILGLLRRWDAWKKIEESPERLDRLEQRVQELESRLERAPWEACPSCGALDFRVVESRPSPQFAQLGIREHVKKCGTCGFEDVVQQRP